MISYCPQLQPHVCSAFISYQTYKDDPPVLPSLRTFPVTLMGDRRRSFHQSWYESHRWILCNYGLCLFQATKYVF